VKVAAEVENPGRARAQHQIAQLTRPLRKHGRDAALPGMKIVEKIRIIAWPAARAHERPQGARGCFPGNLKLLQLEQPLRLDAIPRSERARGLGVEQTAIRGPRLG